MLNNRWILLAGLVSFSSLAGVSLQEKQSRVDALMSMQSEIPTVAFEAYQRALGYEVQGLSIDQSAKNETNLLAEKIRMQVISAYQAALKAHKSPELAREEVRGAIETDLEMANPELKDELMELAVTTLDNAERAGINEDVELENVEIVLRKEVVDRKEFLNQVDQDLPPVAPVSNKSKDSEKKDYKNRAELMESLVSDRESSRWVSTANQTIRTGQVFKADVKVSFQLKMEFLGASIEAGPTISFKRDIATNASILSEGLNPVTKRDGTFDRFKRSADMSPLKKNNKNVPRYIAFTCDAELRFESEYTGSGGFKYMGLGADATISKTFQNMVNLQTRRIALPESVDGKMVNVKMVSDLCHTEFLEAKINDSMTVKESLNRMMKNVISTLVFTHAKTKCAKDNHCKTWFEKDVIALKKTKNTYRCVEDSKDKFRFCQLRGKVNQSCSVIENNKVTSSGVNEYACDWGLKCVKTQNAATVLGYSVSYSKGICKKN